MSIDGSLAWVGEETGHRPGFITKRKNTEVSFVGGVIGDGGGKILWSKLLEVDERMCYGHLSAPRKNVEFAVFNE